MVETSNLGHEIDLLKEKAALMDRDYKDKQKHRMVHNESQTRMKMFMGGMTSKLDLDPSSANDIDSITAKIKENMEFIEQNIEEDQWNGFVGGEAVEEGRLSLMQQQIDIPSLVFKGDYEGLDFA